MGCKRSPSGSFPEQRSKRPWDSCWPNSSNLIACRSIPGAVPYGAGGHSKASVTPNMLSPEGRQLAVCPARAASFSTCKAELKTQLPWGAPGSLPPNTDPMSHPLTLLHDHTLILISFSPTTTV